MVNVVKGIGVVVMEIEFKIGRVGDFVIRFSCFYVDGYVGVEKFNSVICLFGIVMDKGNLLVEWVVIIFDGIYKKYGMVVDVLIVV